MSNLGFIDELMTHNNRQVSSMYLAVYGQYVSLNLLDSTLKYNQNCSMHYWSFSDASVALVAYDDLMDKNAQEFSIQVKNGRVTPKLYAPSPSVMIEIVQRLHNLTSNKSNYGCRNNMTLR